jgi:ATP-dependent Clp protease, protease subunit
MNETNVQIKPSVDYSDNYSMLLSERIIFIGSEITTEVANSVISLLLLLEKQDPKKDICIYINSPGGSVSAGLAIYDTINFIDCDVSTVCIGQAASMGAFLLAAGTKGKRFALENSEIMLHQVMGGFQGQATDIEIAAKRITRIKKTINQILSQKTGRNLEELSRDLERDFYMTPCEAIEYGIIDRVKRSRNER